MKRKDEREYYGFTLNKENTDPSIEKRSYPNSYIIPAIDEVYDPESDTNRVIRYAPGEKTIWLDEQVNQDMNKRAQIQFTNGQLVVNKRQKLLLEFLRASNHNESNQNRMPGSRVVYKEYVPGAKATDLIAQGKKKHEAVSKVYELGFDDMIAYARVLGIDISRDPEEIRYTLTVHAQENPTDFIAGLDNVNNKRKHFVFQGIDAGILSVNMSDNTMRWADSGRVIVIAPHGIDPIDHFVDFSFDTEGERIYEHLRDLLKNKKESRGETKFIEDDIEEMSEDLVALENDVLFAKALEKGVVVQASAGYYEMNGERIGRGKENLISELSTNTDLKRAIISRLES